MLVELLGVRGYLFLFSGFWFFMGVRVKLRYLLCWMFCIIRGMYGVVFYNWNFFKNIEYFLLLNIIFKILG